MRPKSPAFSAEVRKEVSHDIASSTRTWLRDPRQHRTLHCKLARCYLGAGTCGQRAALLYADAAVDLQLAVSMIHAVQLW
eukprot:38019-Rhodomonas_salina.1